MDLRLHPFRFEKLACTVLSILVLTIPAGNVTATNDGAQEADNLKILHIMSYHEKWPWNKDQFRGFRDALNGLNVTYDVYEMDTKRRNSSNDIAKSARQAINRIDSFKPDLIYTNDDNAQKHVAQHYVNSDVPIVFSGVNADPSDYGFTGSSNVTGITEIEHSSQTIRMLREMVPDIRKIALIIDGGPTWPGVVRRVRKAVNELPDIEISSVHQVKTFTEYKNIIRSESAHVDAFGVLGVFTFVDDNNEVVAYEEVLEWTARNSTVPDFSFWGDRVELGTLAAVRVSGYKQGFEAGKKARLILEQGMSPSEIPIEPTKQGEPTLSLARARALKLKVPTSLLLNSKVATAYQWDR